MAAGKSKMASETGSVTLNRALSVSKYQCPHLYNKGVVEANICNNFCVPRPGGQTLLPTLTTKVWGLQRPIPGRLVACRTLWDLYPAWNLLIGCTQPKAKAGRGRQFLTDLAKIQMGLIKGQLSSATPTHVPIPYPPTYPPSHTSTNSSWSPPTLLTPESSVRQGLRT